MKIAFDAKRITHNATGLGNYSRLIVNILSTFYPQNSYLLYTPDKGRQRLREQIKKNANIHFSYPQGGWAHASSFFWRSFGMVFSLKKEKAGIFHGLSNEIPWGLKQKGIRSVVTIHDLIFIRYPKYYHWIDRHIYSFKFRSACRRADRIIAISETTKQDIIRFFHIPEEKIDVVYQGCDNTFMQPVDSLTKESIRKKYQLPEKYILTVGSMESRKNLLLIVKALRQIKEENCLVAIGKRTPYTETVEKYISEHGLGHRIKLLHTVSFKELPAFYQMASLFVYPSYFEGFGIPVLEAIHSGLPVIAAKGSCLEEAGGPGAMYVDPDNETELAGQINKVLSDMHLYKEMVRTEQAYAKRFSDENIAKEIMRVYQKL